jgi:hypothetical protein
MPLQSLLHSHNALLGGCFSQSMYA